MAASDIVGTIGGGASGIAGMVPGIGTGIGAGIGAITSIISGVLKSDEARKQELRANMLRRKSEEVRKQALRPEYLKSLKMNEMAALYGLPSLNSYESDIEKDVANNVQSILQSSPDGGVALNAINATLNKSYEAKNKLYAEDALARERKINKVADTVWNTGDKQMDLVAMQRADKRDLNTAAANLENSATANKIGSMDQILSTVGAVGSTAGKLIDNNAGDSVATGTTGMTLKDGTQVSPETLAAIMAIIKGNNGSVLPYKYQ